jgi:hypothetical protein
VYTYNFKINGGGNFSFVQTSWEPFQWGFERLVCITGKGPGLPLQKIPGRVFSGMGHWRASIEASMTLDALVRKILVLLYGPALLVKGDG